MEVDGLVLDMVSIGSEELGISVDGESCAFAVNLLDTIAARRFTLPLANHAWLPQERFCQCYARSHSGYQALFDPSTDACFINTRPAWT